VFFKNIHPILLGKRRRKLCFLGRSFLRRGAPNCSEFFYWLFRYPSSETGHFFLVVALCSIVFSVSCTYFLSVFIAIFSLLPINSFSICIPIYSAFFYFFFIVYIILMKSFGILRISTLGPTLFIYGSVLFWIRSPKPALITRVAHPLTTRSLVFTTLFANHKGKFPHQHYSILWRRNA